LGDLASLDLRQLDLNLNGDRGFGWKCWRGDVEWSGTEVSSAEYFHGAYGT